MLRIHVLMASLWVALLSAPVVRSGDLYDAAVQQPGRTEADRKRDALDRPAEMMRLAGLKPGMRVLDFLAGDGYYSELASPVVGPKGHVVLANDAAFEKWSGGAWRERLKDGRLPNVEHRVVDWKDLKLGDAAFDAVLLIKVYHDLYAEDPSGEWPKIDVSSVLDEIARALKPGGVVLLVDHSAKAGTGTSAATSLHRIDESFTVKDFEKHGLRVIARSDLLRNSKDARDQLSYKPPAVGKTDRFVLVLRKSPN